MKVSVIMGVYNANKKMLNLAIASILSQTYRDFEFIICDDGSINETYKWLKEFKRQDSRIVLIKNEINKGLAFTLNRCIKISKDELLIRQDADDYSAEDRIEKIVDIYSQNKKYDIISSNIFLFEEKGTWGKMNYPQKPIAKDFLFCVPFMHGAVAMKRQAVIDVGGYTVSKGTKRTEDLDLFMKLYANGGVGYTIQENLYFYREDKNAQNKRKYRFKIDEAKTKFKGFIELRLMPLGIIFVIKPLVVGLIPNPILCKWKDTFYKRRI